MYMEAFNMFDYQVSLEILLGCFFDNVFATFTFPTCHIVYFCYIRFVATLWAMCSIFA